MCENKVYAVFSENVACHNLCFFWVKNYFEIYLCKVCDKLHVCLLTLISTTLSLFDNYWKVDQQNHVVSDLMDSCESQAVGTVKY